MTARRDNILQNAAALIASYKAVNDRVMAGEKPSDEQLVAALFTGGAAAINIIAGMAIDLERLASAAETMAENGATQFFVPPSHELHVSGNVAHSAPFEQPFESFIEFTDGTTVVGTKADQWFASNPMRADIKSLYNKKAL